MPPGWDEAGSWLDDLARPELGPVSWLGELPPSARLMAELEGLPADLVEDDHDAVEMVALWKSLESYCGLRVRLAAAALARRQSMAHGLAALPEILESDGRGGVAVDVSVAADELGVRLGVSRLAAKRLIGAGQAMSGVGVLVGEALGAGEIDATKADAILDAVADLPAEAALEVQERVLERAAHLPPSAVRREVNAACAGVDVTEYEERCKAERAKRRVCRPRPLPHGMAGLYAVLPAVEATQLYRAVDAAARSAKAVGDQRTMDQLRADALALMGSVAVQTGWIGPPDVEGGRPVGSGAASPDPESLGGTDGVEPVAGRAEMLGGRRRRRDGRRRGRWAPARSGAGAVADAERDMAAGSAARTGADPPPAEGLRGEVCPPGRMRVGVIGGRSAHVRVVVPYTVLMAGPPHNDGAIPGDGLEQRAANVMSPGSLDAPAYLDGYGPIPGSVARALAAGSTWARLVTDPVDGSVRELSAPTYRPPAALADLVRAERPMCIRPDCSVEADSCDLNHNPPWPIGATEFDHLDPMCRRDHLLITHAGWSYEDVELPDVGDGGGMARVWTTGTGHAYLQRADGALVPTGERVVKPRTDRPQEPRAGHPTWGEPPY